MSRLIETRLCRLEQCSEYRAADGRGCVCHIREGETFGQACKRQGLTGGVLVIPEILPPDDWCRIAKAQQAELTKGTTA